MISYLGTWAVADQAGITTETLRSIRRARNVPTPDALIGAEITLTDDSVVAACGRELAGWLPRHIGAAARSVAAHRTPQHDPVGYLGVAQLAARWCTGRGQLDAAIRRARIAADSEILLADGRRVRGFLPGRLADLDDWAAQSLHRPPAAVRTGRGRPRITVPTGADITVLVDEGLSWRQIASRTGLSHETARTRYREHIGGGMRAAPSA